MLQSTLESLLYPHLLRRSGMLEALEGMFYTIQIHANVSGRRMSGRCGSLYLSNMYLLISAASLDGDGIYLRTLSG